MNGLRRKLICCLIGHELRADGELCLRCKLLLKPPFTRTPFLFRITPEWQNARVILSVEAQLIFDKRYGEVLVRLRSVGLNPLDGNLPGSTKIVVPFGQEPTVRLRSIDFYVQDKDK